MNRLAKLLSSLPPYPESAEEYDIALAEATKASTEPHGCYFWMDTLCVPVNNPSLRQQAINKMSTVYKSASNVLVLDAELMRHPSTKQPYTEIFTRITCSTWLRRLWTLQEATLNRNLLFQFADRALYAGSCSLLYQSQRRDYLDRPWDLVAWECNRYAFNFLEIFPYFTYAQRMTHIWMAIQDRTTGRGGDEPLCIAILLDLDIEELQREPDAGSVRKFWRLHRARGVLSSVLFTPGPRLKVEGLGWALENLLDLINVGDGMYPMASVTPRGLCGQYPAIFLEHLRYPVRCVIVCEVDGHLFLVRQVLRLNTPPWEGLQLHKRAQLAILLLTKRGWEEGVTSAREGALGALVETVAEGEQRYVRYLRCVSVGMKGSFRDRHPNTPWSSVELEEKEKEPVKGVFLPLEQKWCVG